MIEPNLPVEMYLYNFRNIITTEKEESLNDFLELRPIYLEAQNQNTILSSTALKPSVLLSLSFPSRRQTREQTEAGTSRLHPSSTWRSSAPRHCLSLPSLYNGEFLIKFLDSVSFLASQGL